MNPEIKISNVSEQEENSVSADRISFMLAETFSKSDWVKELDATIDVTKFFEHPERVVIQGVFDGTANGREFNFPFERDYEIDNNVGAETWIRNPVFGLIALIARSATEESDPEKRTANWLVRSELEIADLLESKINRVVRAPSEGARVLWRNAVVLGISVLAIVSIAEAIYLFAFSNRFRDEELGERIIGTAMCALFAGLPSGLSASCLVLTCAPKSIESTVSGQTLIRFVGAKNLVGLRLICGFGAILGAVGATVLMIQLAKA